MPDAPVVPALPGDRRILERIEIGSAVEAWAFSQQVCQAPPFHAASAPSRNPEEVLGECQRAVLELTAVQEIIGG